METPKLAKKYIISKMSEYIGILINTDDEKIILNTLCRLKNIVANELRNMEGDKK